RTTPRGAGIRLATARYLPATSFFRIAPRCPIAATRSNLHSFRPSLQHYVNRLNRRSRNLPLRLFRRQPELFRRGSSSPEQKPRENQNEFGRSGPCARASQACDAACTSPLRLPHAATVRASRHFTGAMMRDTGPSTLIGSSKVIVELRAEIKRIAHSNARVLIIGESGVGKEVVARSIYAASPRRGSPFVPVNCAGIPETLLESELFGHVKGSFTGAYRDKLGKLEMPAGGTIFLDEIGEMTPRMQGLFLRYLETGEVQKIGSEGAVTANNVRVIAATNRNLRQQIADGHF